MFGPRNALIRFNDYNPLAQTGDDHLKLGSIDKITHGCSESSGILSDSDAAQSHLQLGKHDEAALIPGVIRLLPNA